MHQNDMELKYTWQARHGKINHANRHHGLLVISNTKCNKTLLVPDLVKIRKTGAETDIILLYKQVQNYMKMISNMTYQYMGMNLT